MMRAVFSAVVFSACVLLGDVVAGLMLLIVTGCCCEADNLRDIDDGDVQRT